MKQDKHSLLSGLLCALVVPFLTVRVAFLYEDMRPNRFQNFCSGVYPTYRVSLIVYPQFSNLHLTWALSKVEDGKAEPVFNPVGVTIKENHD